MLYLTHKRVRFVPSHKERVFGISGSRESFRCFFFFFLFTSTRHTKGLKFIRKYDMLGWTLQKTGTDIFLFKWKYIFPEWKRNPQNMGLIFLAIKELLKHILTARAVCAEASRWQDAGYWGLFRQPSAGQPGSACPPAPHSLSASYRDTHGVRMPPLAVVSGSCLLMCADIQSVSQSGGGLVGC